MVLKLFGTLFLLVYYAPSGFFFFFLISMHLVDCEPMISSFIHSYGRRKCHMIQSSLAKLHVHPVGLKLTTHPPPFSQGESNYHLS